MPATWVTSPSRVTPVLVAAALPETACVTEEAALVRDLIKRSPRRSRWRDGDRGGDLGPRRRAAGGGRSCLGCTTRRGRRGRGPARLGPRPPAVKILRTK